MKNYYSTVDNVVLTYSDMCISQETGVRVYFSFELPIKTGFKIAEGFLPDCVFTKVLGFSEDELFELEAYVKANALLLWELAQRGN